MLEQKQCFDKEQGNWSTISMQNIINELHHEKTNIVVSVQVRHKPGCTATEDG